MRHLIAPAAIALSLIAGSAAFAAIGLYLRQSAGSRPTPRSVDAALAAGALGAKLSGGGRGGNMIALVTEPSAGAVEKALRSAGAVRTWVTTVNATCKG